MKWLFCIFILSLYCIQLYAINFSENCIQPWGADSDLQMMTQQEGMQKQESSIGQKICLDMILFFQHYISAIDGPRSSFYPTSSQYTLEAIEKYGVWRGIALGCDRLMRENRQWWIYDTTDQYGFDRKLDPVR